MRLPCLLLLLTLLPACDPSPAAAPEVTPDGGPTPDQAARFDLATPILAGDGPAPLDLALGDAPPPDDAAPALDGGTGDGGAKRLPDRIALVIIVGDSVAAGYNAQGLNAAGGHGYARLTVNNHKDFPAYQGHDLATLFPGVDFRSAAKSGATSSDTVGNLKSALAGSLPKSVPGDVVVLINVGGNDFNDSPTVMVSPQLTANAAAKLRQNLAQIVQLLKARYDDPQQGKEVLFLFDNIHDPTDGMGSVPKQFTNGFCKLLANPLFTPQVRQIVLANLATMNAAIAAEATAQGARLVDIHRGFLGHGMSSGAGRWIDTDCVHPTNPGHDLIRRLAWEQLTGERF